jgi:hypothetical protein
MTRGTPRGSILRRAVRFTAPIPPRAAVIGVAFGLIVYFGMDPAASYLTQSVSGHAQLHRYPIAVRFKMASMAAGVGAISMLMIGVNAAVR